MWPGRRKSSAWVSWSASAITVCARSSAETPVVVPCRASTETVNAGRFDSVFCSTICGSWSWSSRSPVIGWQMIPLVWRIMKASFSGVAFSAAMIRSPSFSRFSSSATITSSPAAMARRPSSIDAVVVTGPSREASLTNWLIGQSMLRDPPALGLAGQSALHPGHDPAGQVVGVPARRPEGLRGHRGARAEAALEDDRPVSRQLLGPPRQPLELDVPCPRDAARIPLVLLAHVHELDLAALEPLAHLLGLELMRRVGEGAGDHATEQFSTLWGCKVFSRRLSPPAACDRPATPPSDRGASRVRPRSSAGRAVPGPRPRRRRAAPTVR